jgi:hypothetical protein
MENSKPKMSKKSKIILIITILILTATIVTPIYLNIYKQQKTTEDFKNAFDIDYNIQTISEKYNIDSENVLTAATNMNLAFDDVATIYSAFDQINAALETIKNQNAFLYYLEKYSSTFADMGLYSNEMINIFTEIESNSEIDTLPNFNNFSSNFYNKDSQFLNALSELDFSNPENTLDTVIGAPNQAMVVISILEDYSALTGFELKDVSEKLFHD